jgi:hypothetical protein
MKKIKIILITMGVALTTFTFGQLLSQSDGSILFYNVAYNPTNNRLVHNLNEFTEHRAYGDEFQAPLVTRTYFRPLVNDLVLEPWMTEPFESNFFEPEPEVESWMTAPFESNYYEAEIMIESWMTAPFESNYFEAEIMIESWMTAPFESNYYEVEPFIESWMIAPFNCNYYEEDPLIESWMTTPFIPDDDLVVEDWMTQAWI